MNPPNLRPLPKGAGTIAIKDIIVPERLRTEDEKNEKWINDVLVPSIAENGLIQLPVLEDDERTLRAGRSRMLALIKLGYVELNYNVLGQMSESDKLVIEFEENEVRHEMSWQDRVLSIRKIFYKKKAEKSKNHERWGYRQAGLLLNTAFGHTRDMVSVGDEILAGNEYIATAPDLTTAIKRMYEQVEQQLHKELARRSAGSPVAGVTIPRPSTPTQIGPTYTVDDDDPFGELTSSVTERVAPQQPTPLQQFNTIHVPLASRIVHGDCLEVMWNMQPETFDGIVTDPPYGNDFDEVEGISGIESVRHVGTEWHDEEIMPKFFKLAFKVLKPDSWMFVFYDIRHHEKMLAWAQGAGFKAQGYPLHWIKTHPCRNNAPQYRATKAVEYVFVCRKGNASLHDTGYWPNHFACDGMAEKRAQGNPYAKPFEFCEWMMKRWVVKGMDILDPFMGGASILRHCIRLGLVPHGIEMNPEHFHQAVESLRETYVTLAGKDTTFDMPQLNQALVERMDSMKSKSEPKD